MAGRMVSLRSHAGLRRQNEKLAKDLARTQAALEIMGKAHALLGLLSESTDPEREAGSSG